jgi:hypothetical protein
MRLLRVPETIGLYDQEQRRNGKPLMIFVAMGPRLVRLRSLGG